MLAGRLERRPELRLEGVAGRQCPRCRRLVEGGVVCVEEPNCGHLAGGRTAAGVGDRHVECGALADDGLTRGDGDRVDGDPRVRDGTGGTGDAYGGDRHEGRDQQRREGVRIHVAR